MSAAEERDVFRRAQGRTLHAFAAENERHWEAPFYFIQGADPQFGLMKAWADGDCSSGGDEWEQEIRLTEQAVQAINRLDPKPKFFVLCGDLIHGMPGTPWREEQIKDLKRVLKNIDRDIPLSLDEDDSYFNITKPLRQEMMDKFVKAGIKAVFSGHYHRNAGARCKDLDMVVSSAIGCQLGKDAHGLRVVVVTAEKIVHRYYSLNELSDKGVEKDLMDLMMPK
uniref:Calcineurin like phosphoesterase domain containing 1 n=1 Tax=Ornithorhynchus anatinus TaxID=9258 RepID=A0A6I8NC11_ORNAN